MALQKYKCHKVVEAAKITAIEFAMNGIAIIATNDGQTVTTDTPYKDRFKVELGDNDLGYYVVYADGYESWSPTKAFEEGYTKIE
jgi:hypothetical protein